MKYFTLKYFKISRIIKNISTPLFEIFMKIFIPVTIELFHSRLCNADV